MAGWTRQENVEGTELTRFAPRDLTNSKDFSKVIRGIDADETLTQLDKYRYKKQLMRTVYQAKQLEIKHHLNSYENYLLARTDVEEKSIALEAQKAITLLEKEQLEMMKELGLSHSEEISNTLIKAGTMLTNKIGEIERSSMTQEIKMATLKRVERVWEKTNDRIMQSVDTYIDELYEKEKRRGG
ncbi:MAG: hypothetical protein ACOC45_04760 [Alkalispirochaetaceae bacterium]